MNHQQINLDLKTYSSPQHPLRAALEITGRCPNSCVHCYARPLKDMDDMSLDDAKKILDSLKSNGYKSVYIVGGEPMLHQSIVEILSYSHSLGFETILVTNGYRLSESSIIDQILPFVDQIEMSIRSDSALDHDKIVSGYFPSDNPKSLRPGFNYMQTIDSLNNISNLKKSHRLTSPKLAINIDLHNPRIADHSVIHIVQKIQNYGIILTGVYLQIISLSGAAQQQNPTKIKQNFFISHQNLIIALNDLLTIKNKYQITDIGIIDDPVNHDNTDIASLKQIPHHLRSLIIGEKIPAIAPNGLVRQNVIKLYFQ